MSIQRFGEPPRAGQRYVMRPGAYAVLLQGEEMLVTYQDAPFFEFQLPGGGIDPGEGPLQALNREVFEETGWTISQPRRLGAFRRFVYMPEYDMHAEKLCSIYLARPARCLGAPPETDHTAVWMPVQEALTTLSGSGDRYFLARLLGLKR